MDFTKLREIILRPCKNVIKIPFDVEKYESVINLWKSYLMSNQIPLGMPEIRLFFSFHKDHDEHILLYSSENLSEVLLMCKIDGRYSNFSLPIDMSRYGNFVAVYTL